MTRGQALRQASEALAATSIPDARLVSELLLMHLLGVSRARLYVELDSSLTPEHENEYRSLVERSLNGEPAAYITGCREFFGLDFQVDRRVLIPRPESELLVETSLRLSQKQPIESVADVGTGSGAISISLALRLPGVKIYGIDISPDALEVARINCERHGVQDRVCLLEGDLLEPLPVPVDLIIANLPYVRECELSTGALAFEPRVALDGGADGLDCIRRLALQVKGKLRRGGRLLMEIGDGQAYAVAGPLANLYPGAAIELIPDLGGTERVASLALESPTGCQPPQCCYDLLDDERFHALDPEGCTRKLEL